MSPSSSSHEDSAESSSEESEFDVVSLEAVEVEGRPRAEVGDGLRALLLRDTFVKLVTACNLDFVDFEIEDLLILLIQDGQVFWFVASETVRAEPSCSTVSLGEVVAE